MNSEKCNLQLIIPFLIIIPLAEVNTLLVLFELDFLIELPLKHRMPIYDFFIYSIPLFKKKTID